MSSEPPNHDRKRSHIPELDGIRGLAILLVLFAHLGIKRIFYLPVGWGHHGVDLFFILSGFLITRIRLYEQSRDIPLRNFWIRRITRIFPAAYLCLVLVAILWGPSYHIVMAAVYASTFDSRLLSDAPDLPPISHFWTLAVEEQFYLIWPLILTFGVTRSKAVAVTAMALFMTSMVIHGLFGESWGETPELYTLLTRQVWTRGWPLLLGSLVALAEPTFRRRPTLLLLGGIVAGITAVVLRLIGIVGERSFSECNWTQIESMGVQVFMSGVFFFALFANICKIRTPFTFSPLRWIGRISYGLYLYHLPIYFLFDATSDGSGRWGAVIASFAVASISFYFFEQPIIAWGRRMSRTQEGAVSSLKG